MAGLPPALADAFLRQAEACRALGSPFTAALVALLAERLAPRGAFGARIHGWRGEPVADALALRAAGALHALARSGRVPALTGAYPPAALDAERLWTGIEAGLAADDAFLAGFLESAPQTNEAKRSGAILGALLVVARETGLPLSLLEIGASAGLNLLVDRFAYDLGIARRPGAPEALVRCAWRGRAPDPLGALDVVARAGCDMNPLDPASPADRERLLAYVWADQTDRLALAEGALALAAQAPWRVERADAADWAERALARAPREGVATVLVHTIMWQYLPAPTQARVEAALAEAGARATPTAPLARVAMETDATPGSAALALTLWPGGAPRLLGRADFHGRSVDWA